MNARHKRKKISKEDAATMAQALREPAPSCQEMKDAAARQTQTLLSTKHAAEHYNTNSFPGNHLNSPRNRQNESSKQSSRTCGTLFRHHATRTANHLRKKWKEAKGTKQKTLRPTTTSRRTSEKEANPDSMPLGRAVRKCAVLQTD
jgi:hypothetical protein